MDAGRCASGSDVIQVGTTYAVAAFPIMMGSCAFLMPVARARFLREGRYHLSPSVGLTLGGVPALLIAAYLVKSLPLTAVRWVVLFVVFFTATMLLQAGRREARALRLGSIAPSEAPVTS